MTPPDPWVGVRHLTPARIALGRSGVSLPTDEVLRFGLAHARARDAVHRPLDLSILGAAFPDARAVASLAPDRATYLRRPDLGRRLGAGDLSGVVGDVALVLADGLSPMAVEAQAPALVAALRPALATAGLTVSVPVIATQARVALGDAVAAAIGARAVLVLIGERPGLSVPASLGAYLTWSPASGVTTDADRNCVSNIQPDGLLPADAAARIVWLLVAARDRGGSGVALKDDSGGLARLSGVSGGDHTTSGGP